MEQFENKNSGHRHIQRFHLRGGKILHFATTKHDEDVFDKLIEGYEQGKNIRKIFLRVKRGKKSLLEKISEFLRLKKRTKQVLCRGNLNPCQLLVNLYDIARGLSPCKPLISSPLPSAISFSLSWSSFEILTIAPVIDSTLNGSTYNAASPATSGIDEIFDVITAVPQANASRIGIPNPS